MPFRFKQFSVEDSQCAMKVGTDSVLLGAWTDYSGCSRLLDIGTGCGLLALIAAQRSTTATASQSNILLHDQQSSALITDHQTLITAIDIDADACRQAEENFRKSQWNSRLQCIHQGLEEFTLNRQSDHKKDADHRMPDNKKEAGHISESENALFDLIITNPPYFINSLKSPHTGRNTARHNDELPLDSLLSYSALLLTDAGKLSIVFPYAESNILINTAQKHALNLSRQLIIIPKQGKKPNRILLEFTKTPVEIVETTELAIRAEEGKFTSEYVKLTEDFYLGLRNIMI
jgi:tRNA1Val (adenine37-N6)-methyltransferase